MIIGILPGIGLFVDWHYLLEFDANQLNFLVVSFIVEEEEVHP